MADIIFLQLLIQLWCSAAKIAVTHGGSDMISWRGANSDQMRT